MYCNQSLITLLTLAGISRPYLPLYLATAFTFQIYSLPKEIAVETGGVDVPAKLKTRRQELLGVLVCLFFFLVARPRRLISICIDFVSISSALAPDCPGWLKVLRKVLWFRHWGKGGLVYAADVE